MRIILRVLVNAVALWGAARLIDGIDLTEEIVPVLIVAAIFGVVNAILRPVLFLLSLPAIILTLGLFTFVVNGVLLLITDWLTGYLSVDGLWNAILGAIVISLVSWVLGIFLPDDED
ncbi:MAG: phage holin family protein [Actinomycetota bacterium]